jgi:hypothetical protein
LLVLTACGQPSERIQVTKEPPVPVLHDEVDNLLQTAMHAQTARIEKYLSAVALNAYLEAIARAERERVEASNRKVRVGKGAPSSTGRASAHPCGGSLPPCYVMMRESGGDIHAENPHSTASGKWQFVDGTWGGYGGYGHASNAPESVQDERARQVWAGGAGCSHWSACA